MDTIFLKKCVPLMKKKQVGGGGAGGDFKNCVLYFKDISQHT
jgi:hypothetical protein